MFEIKEVECESCEGTGKMSKRYLKILGDTDSRAITTLFLVGGLILFVLNFGLVSLIPLVIAVITSMFLDTPFKPKGA